MALPRLVAPFAASALLATAAVALAPAASAHGGLSSLPAAASVAPSLTSVVTITATGDASAPTAASAQWTIPACSGTVYAEFVLRQQGAGGSPSVYLQDKGFRAYPCQPAPQAVTVLYGPADPSQAVLTTSPVVLTTTTSSAASGGEQTSSASTTVKAVASAKGLPKGSAVVPRYAQGVVRHDGGSAAARWVVPACTGSVRAVFTLFQDGESSPRAAQGPTTYPCSPADQLVTVQYGPTGGGAPAVHTGPADLWVDTLSARGGATSRPLQSAGTTATVS
ncbi:MAG: hypothetical protein PGN11_01760 [Quadrisphaera sp.]